MSTQTILDTDQVLGIATQIENDNKQLQQILNDSKTTIDNLYTYWTGPAAEECHASYDSFANKFFQTYYDTLDKYVAFLRINVAEGYVILENEQTSLSDAFN